MQQNCNVKSLSWKLRVFIFYDFYPENELVCYLSFFLESVQNILMSVHLVGETLLPKQLCDVSTAFLLYCPWNSLLEPWK